MNWKEVLIIIVVMCAIFALAYFTLIQETKIIEGEVIDVEILDNGFTTYWKLYFKDGTVIEARPSGYGGNTYDFVKNSRVLIHFTRSKHMPSYWTIDSIIKLPNLVDGE